MYKKVAYFRDGVLFNVIPRNFSVSLYDDRQVAYDADTVIISDKDVYVTQKEAPLRYSFDLYHRGASLSVLILQKKRWICFVQLLDHARRSLHLNLA